MSTTQSILMMTMSKREREREREKIEGDGGEIYENHNNSSNSYGCLHVCVCE